MKSLASSGTNYQRSFTSVILNTMYTKQRDSVFIIQKFANKMCSKLKCKRLFSIIFSLVGVTSIVIHSVIV